MTTQQLIQYINQDIKTNSNKEITGNILNGVLLAMVNQINSIVGGLNDLSIPENDNLVSALNWLVAQLSNSHSVTIHTGTDNPNQTPPDNYSVGDLYSQLNLTSTPADLWIFTGVDWIVLSDFKPLINNPQNGQILQFENGAWQNTFLDLQGDRFLQRQQIQINKTSLTIPLGFTWKINNVTYSNPTNFIQNIAFASSKKYRFDKFVALTNNSFLYLIGEEDEINPTIPQTPQNTLEVTTIRVNDSGLGELINPKKEEKQNACRVITVTENIVLSHIHDGNILLISRDVIVIIPNNLGATFTGCGFDVKSGKLTFAIQPGVKISGAYNLEFKTNEQAYLYKESPTSNFFRL